MKLLLSAYACEPGIGSEPGVGWNWAQQAARFADVWVMTRESNRPRIEAYLAENPNENLHFEFLDLPEWARFWKKGRRGVHAYYYLWQVLAGQTAQRLHKEHGFDAVQHVTFVNSWMPSFVWRTGAPFVWGPINTNAPVPRAFQTLWDLGERAQDALRSAITWSAPRVRPDVLATANHAEHIICGSEYVQNLLPLHLRSKSSIIWQNGVHTDDVTPLKNKKKQANRPFRVITVGRLIAIKGLDLAIRAFAAADLPTDAELVLIGDGPWRERLESLTDQLDMSHRIEFRGTVDRTEVLNAFRESDVLLFPSFEGAGMVVMEAMACGLPVVALEHGGPGEYLDEHTGFRVPVTDPDTVVVELGDALHELYTDKKRRQEMSQAAIQRAQEEFSWDQRGEALRTLLEGMVS